MIYGKLKNIIQKKFVKCYYNLVEERKWKWSRSVMSDSLWPHGLQPTRLLRPWDFPGKSTGLGCHCLLQEIFPTQGLNPGLPHCRETLYHLSHQGRPGRGTHNKSLKTSWEVSGFVPVYSGGWRASTWSVCSATQSCPLLCDPMSCKLPRSSVHGIFQARVLEWGAIAFSRGSSQPRDQTIKCMI